MGQCFSKDYFTTSKACYDEIWTASATKSVQPESTGKPSMASTACVYAEAFCGLEEAAEERMSTTTTTTSSSSSSSSSSSLSGTTATELVTMLNSPLPAMAAAVELAGRLQNSSSSSGSAAAEALKGLQPAALEALVPLMQDSSNRRVKVAAAAIISALSKLPSGRLMLRPITANPIGSAVLAGLYTVLKSPAVGDAVKLHTAFTTIVCLVPEFVDERGVCYMWSEHNRHEPHPWPAVEAAISHLALELTTWEATSALHHLLAYPCYRERIQQQPGVFSALLNLLPQGAVSAVGDAATAVLTVLCTGNPTNQQKVLNDANFLPRLRGALSTPGYRTQQLWPLMSALGDNNPAFVKQLGHDEPCVARLASCLNTAGRHEYAELLCRIALADASSLGAISKQPGVEQALMNTLTYHSGRLTSQIREWRDTHPGWEQQQ